MEKLDKDILAIMKRRAYDLCGTVEGVKIIFNGTILNINNFNEYSEMFIKPLQDQERITLIESGEYREEGGGDRVAPRPIIYEKINNCWDVAVVINESSINQLSFVNNIATTKGGTHVNCILDQIVNHIIEYLVRERQISRALLLASRIEQNIFVFVNCRIQDPSFYSRTNELLNTKASQFQPRCILPPKFLNKVLYALLEVKSVQDLIYRSVQSYWRVEHGGKFEVNGVADFEDAVRAGTPEGHKCTLVLADGDSAMALAVAGLAAIGRDYYGTFPLRGELLNVRDASDDEIKMNREIKAIKMIMGLEFRNYNSTNKLRYGHIMIITNQDHEGSYTKGSIINLFDKLFPGLLSIPGFLVQLVTPKVEVSILNNNRVVNRISFNSAHMYKKWREKGGKTCSWKAKSKNFDSIISEGAHYFSQLGKYLMTFDQLQKDDKKLIEVAFSKKNKNARREWLASSFRTDLHLDPDVVRISIGDFVNKDLIHYFMVENIRNIPSVMDGFKPHQRKVLYGCLKGFPSSSFNVSELADYVREEFGYQDQQLFQAIAELTQAGPNNISFLTTNDAGSHYILNQLTRKVVLHVQDDPLYKYLEESYKPVEPEWYAPIIPTILVNGADGVGADWNTKIPSYNPEDLVKNIHFLMNNKALEPMNPWYRHWTGTITRLSDIEFKSCGAIKQTGSTTVEITELPINMSISMMKKFLLGATIKKYKNKRKKFIKSITEEHGKDTIKFIITLTQSEMKKSLKQGLEKRFKLESTINTANMVAFDSQGRIKMYNTPEQILTEFYEIRLELYQKRKIFMCRQLKNELKKISFQAKYIKCFVDRALTTKDKKFPSKSILMGFPKFVQDGIPVFSHSINQRSVEDDDSEVTVQKYNPPVANYDYLLEIDKELFNREGFTKLLQQVDHKKQEYTELVSSTAMDLWKKDLDYFLDSWQSIRRQEALD